MWDIEPPPQNNILFILSHLIVIAHSSFSKYIFIYVYESLNDQSFKLGIPWGCEGPLYKYIIAHRHEGCSCSFGALRGSDAVSAAHAAGSHLMTYTELCEQGSTPAAAQCIAGQRGNRDLCYLCHLVLSVKINTHKKFQSNLSCYSFFMNTILSQLFSSYLIYFLKLDTMFLVLCH